MKTRIAKLILSPFARLPRWRRKHWALNIRQRFLALSIVLAVAGGCAFIVGDLLLDLQSEQDDYNAQAMQLRVLVESVTSTYLQNDHFRPLDAILRKLVTTSDIVSIAIYDWRNGIVIDTSAPAPTTLSGDIPPLLAEVRAWGGVRTQMQENFYTAAFPIRLDDGGLAAGQIVVAKPSTGVILADIFERSGLVALLSFLIMAPCAWIMLDKALQPLRELSEACRRVGHGQNDIEIETQRHDEVGLLALHFRRMVRQLQRSLDRAHRLAFIDGVTELPNREFFRRSAREAIRLAEMTGMPGAVLFIDLDRFKRVNDSLGHDFGDLLLREFARRLKACTRATDTVARLTLSPHIDRKEAQANQAPTLARMGGDEFALLLPQLRVALDAAVVARRIVRATREPFELKGHRVFIGASVGIAVFPDDGETLEQLLRAADLALYHSKDQGRDTFEFYSAILNEKATQRFALENELRNALERDEFELYYQPIVDPRCGSLRGVEALLRWRHPVKGIIGPNNFIGVAEETRMIVDIGNWVLRRACRQAETWRASGQAIKVSVNVSLAQFERSGFADTVLTILKEEGLPPELLQLEITESLAMNDPTYTAKTIGPLRDVGVSFALDDFGTGYSSLSILSSLPIDSLKIDRSFIARAAHDPNARIIVETILAMAKSLNHRTVAEGIEEPSQADFVSARGCTLVQGYLYSRPLPPADLEADYFPGLQSKLSA